MIHIGLFEGIGGFSLAARWAGWKTYATCEIAEFPRKVLKYHFSDAYHHGDIKTLTYETIDAELSARFGADWRNDDIIITGGFPCQPYSSAGKRLGKEDDRHLWPEMLRVIREVRPTWIVGENVLGLVNWSGGLVFEEVQADLEAEGYEVQPYVLPAASVGAPHRRDRVWFVAHTNNTRGSAELGQIQSEDGEVPKRHDDAEFSNAGDGVVADTNGGTEGTPKSSAGIKADWREYNLQQSQRRITPKFDSRLYGFSWSSTDTKNARQQTRIKGQEQKQFRGADEPMGTRQWSGFPTQSAVCSRNDGLSYRLDDITFSKWRNESIKAYGNAIVPQVALQIFKAINEYNERTNQPT